MQIRSRRSQRNALPSRSACSLTGNGPAGSVTPGNLVRPGSSNFRISPDKEDQGHRSPRDLLHSGTTGEPKMVLHDHSYPLGHIVTARFWHDLRPTTCTSRSRTRAGRSGPGETSSASGSTGAAIFVYDIRGRFNADRDPAAARELRDHDLLLPAHDLPDADPGRSRTGLTSPSLRHCVGAGEPLNPEVSGSGRSGRA